MTEGGVRPPLPGSDGLVEISEFIDPVTRALVVRINRADPRARMTAELLEHIQCRRSPWARWSRLDHESGTITFTDTCGQRFIYRLAEDGYDQLTDTWLIEWPD